MTKKQNLINVRFGFWVVIKPAENGKNKQTQWLCKCECGTERVVGSNSLRTGNSTSCGCNNTPNLVNSTFGNLIVLNIKECKDKNRRYWSCQCSCGEIITVSTLNLRNNKITSCEKCKKQNLIKNNQVDSAIEIYKDINNISAINSNLLKIIKLNLEILKSQNHLINLQNLKHELQKIVK